MMIRDVVRWLGAGTSLLAFAVTLGCEAQANDDYTGEPLLSLQGNVVLSRGEAHSDLVPRIAWQTAASKDGNWVVLIGGEVTGDFPAKFRFDVTQPPPDDALTGPWPELGFNSKLGLGYLVLRPANSRDRIPMYLDVEENDYACNADGSQCTTYERQCHGDRCRERTVECTQHACEAIEEFSDPEVGEEASWSSSGHCGSERCYTLATSCDIEGDCRSTAYRCDFAQYGELYDAEADEMTTCRLLSESGDTSLEEMDDLKEIAINYVVVYVTEDELDSYYGPLKRGYNLVELPSLEWDAWLELEKCEMAAIEAGIAAYNRDHATDYPPNSADPELVEVRIAAFKSCSSATVVAQPLLEDLTLHFGDVAPQPF